jgi:hypothetical protein
VHLAGVAPAFTLSQCDSEYSRKPPNALSLSRYGQVVKKKKETEINHMMLSEISIFTEKTKKREI